MFNAFTLDVESAKKADQEGGRISQTGKYVGTIKRFEFIVAKSGTKGVDIFFETDSKEEATLTLYTEKSDGTPIFGRDKVMALMTVTGARTLTPQDTTAEKYDFDVGAKIQQPVTIAPEIANKRVGFLIQMEEYQKNDGTIGKKPILISSFREDGFMAKEILEMKTQPEQLNKAYERLMKNGDKKLQGQSAATQQQGYNNHSQNNDLDDDLPF